MRSIEKRFNRAFARWGIALPPEYGRERRRGNIVASGWTIWYLFGSEERGGYFDYYASHRMTDDRHVRIREEGPAEPPPAIRTAPALVCRLVLSLSLPLDEGGDELAVEVRDVGHDAAPDHVAIDLETSNTSPTAFSSRVESGTLPYWCTQ